MSETYFINHYDSPLGRYLIAASNKGIVCLKTEPQAPPYLACWQNSGIELQQNGPWNSELKNELEAYFKGRLTRFTVPLDLRGTAFQLAVWKLLRRIPYGRTCSYLQLAENLGRPRAARAVDGAVGSNPVAIVVPCHRVVGSNGALTGYGGGLQRKAALLEIESRASYQSTGRK